MLELVQVPVSSICKYIVYLIMRHAGSYVGVFIEYLWQEYSVQVTFREQWNDERLRYVDSTKGKGSHRIIENREYSPLAPMTR